jgi:hypothetical protein
MLTRPRFPCTAVFLGCVFAATTYGQDSRASSAEAAQAPAPPSLAYVEGSVDVVQDGVNQRADPPVMLLDGDIVRTRSGRAEVVFGDGTLLHLSEDGELEVLGAEHFRLVGGRVIIRLSHTAARPYVIDTPAATVRLEVDGEYGITADRTARLDVAVTRGSATANGASPWTIRGGQMLTMAGAGGRPLIQPFNSARWDAFAQWAYERSNGFATSYSASQLPYELRAYGPVLDTYGRWDHVGPYGYVWYPSVSASWRPYYDGSWSFTRYGWTWYGHDRWAWPTHHYGRWGFKSGFWFWIPARVWGPAWVSWSFAPGYVGWAPLGWDNHPSIGLWRRRDYPAYWPDYTPWRAWTVLPRSHFAPHQNVRVHAIDGTRLDDNVRQALAQGVPILPASDFAVPRESVIAPGARGGYVRRPQRPYPSNGVTAPAGSAAAPLGPADVTRPATRPRRPVDYPAYAPPRSWSSGEERRGIPRDPGTRTAPRDEGTREPRAVPRNRPESAPPSANAPSSPGASGGAVERGAGRQGSGAGAPSSGPPPGSAPAAGQGGAARRRPGGN